MILQFSFGFDACRYDQPACETLEGVTGAGNPMLVDARRDTVAVATDEWPGMTPILRECLG